MVLSSLVVMPTYNERESLPHTLAALRTHVPEAEVLVVDDGSPDGTGELADSFAADDPRVHVLHRESKAGLGAAYIAGFRWGLDRSYDVLCEMDADGSHRARDLPQLLAAVENGADLAIGSRWVPGGAVVNWPVSRLVLSRGANVYVRTVMGLAVNDATAGFRAYRREVLEGIGLEQVESQGYCFQVDMAWRAALAGFRTVEVPIVFVERELGASKMSRDIITEALTKTTRWGVGHRVNQIRGLLRGKRASTISPPGRGA